MRGKGSVEKKMIVLCLLVYTVLLIATNSVGAFLAVSSYAVYLPLVLKPLPIPTPTPTPTNTPPPVPTATSAPTATPTPTITPIAGQNIQCQQFDADQLCSWVSNGTPAQNSTVVVYGRYLVNGVGQGGLEMTTLWHYKTTTPSCSGSTQATGIASCSRDIGRATLGYTVQVDVVINGHEVQTWFTPQ